MNSELVGLLFFDPIVISNKKKSTLTTQNARKKEKGIRFFVWSREGI